MKTKEELINNCKYQISQIEYHVGLSHTDEHGYISCTKDEHGNYLDENYKIIDINNMEWFDSKSVKEAIDYWKQELKELIEIQNKL